MQEIIFIKDYKAEIEFAALYIPFVPTGQWRLDLTAYTKNAKTEAKEKLFKLQYFFDIALATPKKWIMLVFQLDMYWTNML